MKFRTDLALERRAMLRNRVSGVKVTERENYECKTTVIDVETESAAEKLDKGIGKYITVQMKSFADAATVSDGRLSALREGLCELIPEGEGTVLVAGVGNRDITADALGPMTASHVFATRHIDDELRRRAGFEGKLRSVSSISVDVLGKTGMESSEYIKAICGVIKPSCVITIDALAAGSIDRLGTTVQMSDTGISPGSGIGNTRQRIDESFIGVPVIAVGVPTVVDALSLSAEISGKKPEALRGIASEKANGMIVAPKDIDLIIKNASYLLALALNCALQPEFTAEELYALM